MVPHHVSNNCQKLALKSCRYSRYASILQHTYIACYYTTSIKVHIIQLNNIGYSRRCAMHAHRKLDRRRL